MRNSQANWAFFQNDPNKLLSGKDVQYWKNTFRSILKVGVEFEMNLVKASGTCTGDGKNCPCVYLGISNCWSKCKLEKTCSTEFNRATCKKHQTNECDKNIKDCRSTCRDYIFQCLEINCSQFTSSCLNCKDYIMDCKTCKDLVDLKNRPQAVRKKIERYLEPSHSYDEIGKTGIHSITTDGSLLGDKGVEVITIGRRINFDEFYNMSKNVIDISKNNGAYVNERCSIHMHLLATYYKNKDEALRHNELEKPIPEIILANLHQLCRKYQNAITWMSMGLDDKDKLTRWEKYRVSILDISPAIMTMPEVQAAVYDEAGGRKYGWLNYIYTKFNGNNDVSTLHLEFRVLDGLMSPSAVAAFSCLFYALMIKAVEISRYGLLNIGDENWLDKTRQVKQNLLNNRSGWDSGNRFSDTSNLYKDADFLIEESLNLVHQLKHILMRLGPSYQILEQLACHPIALHRCENKSWEDIEGILKVPTSEISMIEMKVDEFIDLHLIEECNNLDEWLLEINKSLKQQLNQDAKDIRVHVADYILNMQLAGDCMWSDSLGTIVRV